jgi:hypothetical protein
VDAEICFFDGLRVAINPEKTAILFFICHIELPAADHWPLARKI